MITCDVGMGIRMSQLKRPLGGHLTELYTPANRVGPRAQGDEPDANISTVLTKTIAENSAFTTAGSIVCIDALEALASVAVVLHLCCRGAKKIFCLPGLM